MRIVVTRPIDAAERWVAQFAQRGVAALPLPLIDIAAPPDRAALLAAWRSLSDYQALMFVSGQAVAHFFAARTAVPPDAAAAGVQHRLFAATGAPRCLATGPGTVRGLLAAGVPASAIDAPPDDAGQFDSEALWARLASGSWQGARVLIVRGRDEGGDENGGDGRPWLADRLGQAGARVDFVSAYLRRCPRWDADRLAQAQAAARDGSAWLFSSSLAVGHLRRLLPGTDWSGVHAIVTHARIAEAARRAGFAAVRESRPTLDDVALALASIESSA